MAEEKQFQINLEASSTTVAGKRIHDFGKPYVPERDYFLSNYKAIGEGEEHFCTTCKNYYCDLYESKITNKLFPPKCEGDIAQNIQKALDNGEVEPEDVEFLLYKDPITWAAAEFDWMPRWYQKELLRCSSLKKVVRAGRRCGKTAAMAVKILHLLYTNKDFLILVVCPYQSQVKRLFEIIRTDLMAKSKTFKECVVKDNTSAPQIIKLANGSTVTGFSSGAKSGGKSTQIRGQDAHAIFLDEMDYMSEDDFEAVLAILTSHPDCILWASSTPTGARMQFFDWCTQKDLGFKEFHFISAESPNWTSETESFLKNRYPGAGYNREFLAEFGDETAGVFKNSDINKALSAYEYSSCSPNPNFKYVMGVDWNEVHGVHIVITQLTTGPKDVLYKLVHKEVIEKQEFTQIAAVQRIIALDRYWNCSYIYADAGFGTTQVEMLKKYGQENPHSKMHKKIKAYHMQAKIEIKDPITGEMIKKDAKPFMVGVAVRQLEAGRCLLPKIEDTSVSRSEDEEEAALMGLVQQMREFRVEKFSKFGMPTYSQGFEHTLTAWMLSLVGFFMEMSDVNRVRSDLSVTYVGRIGEKLDPDEKNKYSKENIIANTKKEKVRRLPPSRSLTGKRVTLLSTSTRTLLSQDKLVRKYENERIKDRGYISPPKKIGRSTF